MKYISKKTTITTNTYIIFITIIAIFQKREKIEIIKERKFEKNYNNFVYRRKK